MSKLTKTARDKMPAGKFAGPNRSFPVNDRKHQRLAISGATRSEHAGNISANTEAEIKAKARKLLAEGSKDSAKRRSNYKRGMT
jgi:hypothetical protein